MRDQRALDVPVGECDPGLAQVLVDRPQHRHLSAGEARLEHQCAQAVIFELATAHAQERRLEDLARVVVIELTSGTAGQSEVIDPGGAAVIGRDRVRALVGDASTHVLEYRKHVREGDPGDAEQLAADDAVQGNRTFPDLQRSVDAHQQAVAGCELLDPPDVRNRRASYPVGAVGGRERGLVTAEELRPELLPGLLDQGITKIVAPGPNRLLEADLELGGVGLHRRLRIAPQDVVDANEHRLRDVRTPVHPSRAEGIRQDRADSLAVLGVEAVAGNEHETGEETVVGVAPDEQLQPLTLAEAEDPHRSLEQLVGRDLEQRVARIGVDDPGQRLRVMAVGRERSAGEHALDLLADERNLMRALVIGGDRVETEESALADDLAVGPERLDPDVVEI